MFPDTSDQFWGSFLTQVPQAEFDRDMTVEDMSHEPLGFLSSVFCNSQLRWPMVDKEAFTILSTFRRLEYLLLNGASIFTDHGNLAYMFHPEACVSAMPKTAAQHLDGSRMELRQFDYTIVYITGESNCRGDLLSPWAKVPWVDVRVVVILRAKQAG